MTRMLEMDLKVGGTITKMPEPIARLSPFRGLRLLSFRGGRAAFLRGVVEKVFSTTPRHIFGGGRQPSRFCKKCVFDQGLMLSTPQNKISSRFPSVRNMGALEIWRNR